MVVAAFSNARAKKRGPAKARTLRDAFALRVQKYVNAKMREAEVAVGARPRPGHPGGGRGGGCSAQRAGVSRLPRAQWRARRAGARLQEAASPLRARPHR
eukprot:5528372-Pyramimonas_sp.AAC.1